MHKEIIFQEFFLPWLQRQISIKLPELIKLFNYPSSETLQEFASCFAVTVCAAKPVQTAHER